MKPRKYMPVLQLYQAAAVRVFPKVFKPAHCLNGTRVALEVLRTFGIDARAFPVDVEVMNPSYWELVEQREPPDSPAWSDRGAFSVSLDMSEGDGWAGHLVALYDHVIIDSSSGQFARPEKNIHVDAVTVLPWERRQWPCIVGNESGTTMRYSPLIPKVDFHKTPGFTKSPANMEVVGLVLTMMRKLK